MPDIAKAHALVMGIATYQNINRLPETLPGAIPWALVLLTNVTANAPLADQVRALHAHQLAIGGRPTPTHLSAVWVEPAAKPKPIRPGAG